MYLNLKTGNMFTRFATLLCLFLVVCTPAHGKRKCCKKIKAELEASQAEMEKWVKAKIKTLSNSVNDIMEQLNNEDESCPTSWTSKDGKCIKVSTRTGSWSDGRDYCKTFGGQLINIGSADVQQFVTETITSTDTVHTKKFHTSTTYKYQYIHDDVPVTDASFITFAVQACNDAHIALSQEKGVSTRSTFEVVIGGWKSRKSVIRSSPQGKELVAFPHSANILNCNEPRPFWISWKGSSIRVGTGNVVGNAQFISWSGAMHPINYIAISTGWGSSGTWTFTQRTYGTGQFWIGATDLGAESEWEWHPSHDPVSGYTNWLQGQPDNRNGNQHCMSLDLNVNGQWRDYNCDAERNFICEK